jgi:HlyD family secretion protein
MAALTSRLTFLGALDAPREGMHDPRMEMRIGGALVGLFLFGFLGWSAIAHLDSAIHTPGLVRVSGNRQAVQSIAGGVVTAINVKEGDHVSAGQVLIQFATTDAMSRERSLFGRAVGLQAEIARIGAEQSGAAHVVSPVEWLALPPADRADAERALAGEEANLDAQRTLLASQQAVLRQRMAQIGDQIGGYGQRQRSNRRQSALNEDELDGINSLFRKGYATKTRVLALQRSAASIDGEIGATQAEIARLHTASGEARLQMLQLSDQRRQQNAERLRAAQTELESLLPQWKAAREQLDLSVARAPTSGAVLGLAANTVGGVTTPGQKLMEIVPDTRALEVETQVALADANDLRVGQRAEVRIGGVRGRNLPVLDGKVIRVSADSMVDERSGHAYFTATVGVSPQELAKISQEAGLAGVRPGTPVDVVIPLKARTALEYWISPLTARLSPALSEQ